MTTQRDLDQFFETWGFVLAADVADPDAPEIITAHHILVRKAVWYPVLGVSIVAFVPLGFVVPDRRIVFAWLGRAAQVPEVRAAIEPRG